MPTIGDLTASTKSSAASGAAAWEKAWVGAAATGAGPETGAAARTGARSRARRTRNSPRSISTSLRSYLEAILASWSMEAMSTRLCSNSSVRMPDGFFMGRVLDWENNDMVEVSPSVYSAAPGKERAQAALQARRAQTFTS